MSKAKHDSETKHDVRQLALRRREDLQSELEKIDAFLARADQLMTGAALDDCGLLQADQDERPLVLH